MTSRVRDLIPIALTISLGACAHAPLAQIPTDKDAVVSEQAAPTPRAPGLYPQSDFPDMTPEEMGQRFLRFIDSLESYHLLTLARLEDVMQLKLEGPEGGRGKQFNVHMPDSNWYYATVYLEGAGKSPNPSARLSFVNRTDGNADMAPVCGVDFNAYSLALEEMGFVYRKDLELYDVGPTVPFTNDQGEIEYRTMERGHRLSSYQFSRGDVMVWIDARSETNDRSSPGYRHACVTRVVVGLSATGQ